MSGYCSASPWRKIYPEHRAAEPWLSFRPEFRKNPGGRAAFFHSFSPPAHRTGLLLVVMQSRMNALGRSIAFNRLKRFSLELDARRCIARGVFCCVARRIIDVFNARARALSLLPSAAFLGQPRAWLAANKMRGNLRIMGKRKRFCRRAGTFFSLSLARSLAFLFMERCV